MNTPLPEHLRVIQGQSLKLFGLPIKVLYWSVWALLGLYMATQDMIRLQGPLTLSGTMLSLALNLGQNLIWGVISLGTLWIVRRYPLHGRPPIRHWVIHLVGSSIIVPAGLGLVWSLATLVDSSSGFELEAFIGFLFWFFSFHHLVCYWGVIGIHEGLTIIKGYRESEISLSRLESELADAELQTLKIQLNPHFLFNALNTVSTLIHSDPDKADRMLMKLSRFLRISLEQTKETFTTLSAEISLMEDYLQIERVRFGDQINIVLEIPQELRDAQVPAFILQPLVENAIKHGINGRSTGGTLSIRAQEVGGRLVLEIQNDGDGRRPHLIEAQGFGIGLKNTRIRLEQHFGQDQSFELSFPKTGGAISRLSFPLQMAKYSPRFDPLLNSSKPVFSEGGV